MCIGAVARVYRWVKSVRLLLSFRTGWDVQDELIFQQVRGMGGTVSRV